MRKTLVQALVQAPQLLGAIDLPLRGVCAEQVLLQALKNRRQIVLFCQSFMKDSEIQRVLSEVDGDRISALWWYGLRVVSAKEFLEDGGDLCSLSVEELYTQGMMLSEVYDIWYQKAEDIDSFRRKKATKEILRFHQELHQELQKAT